VGSEKKERVIAIKIPEDQYRRLEERAKALGFTLASDYIRYLIFKDLRSMPEVPELTLEPSTLERALAKPLEKLVAEGKIPIEKIIERILPRIERRIFDKVNPFTSKIDSIARHQAELREVVEVVVEKLKSIDERVSNLEKRISEAAKVAPPTKRRRRAMEILKEQGILFESDLAKKIKDRDLFFSKLASYGAKVLELKSERVAIDPEMWTKFIEKIKALRTGNEDEIKRRLSNKEYRLFRELRESAMIYFDSVKGEWKFIAT